MADEDDDDDGGGKKKGGLLKIILIVLVVLILLVGAVVGTLFFTGFFDKKPVEENVEATLEQTADVPKLKVAGGEAKDGSDGKDASKEAPKPKTKPLPETVRFEQTYLELPRALLANLNNSRKVMQVTVAIMTHYDDRVIRNIQKHEFAIRSGVLDLMRQVTEADTAKPEFRKELAERIRIEMNALLEKYTGFGGIEEVHFTEFVIQ
jgi:flagellar protein FliL